MTNELKFTLEGGVDFTGNVMLELARAKGVTVQEAKKLGSEGKISFEELEEAVSAAAAIQHAKDAVTYKNTKWDWEEEMANIEALKLEADRMKSYINGKYERVDTYFDDLKSKAEEELSETREKTARKLRELLKTDLIFTRKENPADFSSYVSDITKPIVFSGAEDTEIKITKAVESIEADSDSVVIFRSATNRWEKVSYWGDDDQELADLLLTQKIIDQAVTIAKQNSRWGI